MQLSRRGLILSAGGALLASALPGLSQPARREAGTIVLRGAAFGASWTFTAGEGSDEAAVCRAFEKVIAAVDGTMSPFRGDSELTRFNRTATTDWQDLSPATGMVVREALRIAASTGNAFNPTVGPMVGRYGFGPIRHGVIGLPEEIALADGAIRKARAELSLDLCGIAKGYALDCMVTACREQGLDNFFIELGGEVFATGSHPSGRRWQAGIARLSQPAGVQRVVALGGGSLATSGSAVNGYAYGGRRYSHIIDPGSGRPTDTRLASVTVAAASAMTADALATALFAMGSERGPDFARRAGIEAFFVMDDAQETATGGFEARILA